MAEPSPGWLIPDDLGPAAVRQRALDLLGGFLTEEQRFEAERFGGYRVEHPGRTFWIPLSGVPRCALLDEGTIQHVCIGPRERAGLPDGDIALTYHLWISTDPDGFLAEANVMRSETFDSRCTSDELVQTLARTGRPAAGRRPRRRGRRSQAVIGALPRSSIEELRALFERHDKPVPDEVLHLLAGTPRLRNWSTKTSSGPLRPPG